jgi:ribosomal protein S18 acetylase RimI-like enzyme
MEITLRLLGRGDAAVLGRVAEGVFDHPVDPALAAELLADPRHHLAVAVADGVVVGMASGVHYVHPDKPPELWVNEVGVAPGHRGAGLGRRLLELLLEHGRELGCREAWVLTQAGNDTARRLYRRAGGREDAAVVMYDFDLTKP